MMSEVAPDGSPVPVYLALPAGTTPALIDSAIAPRSTILELGSGPGRITRALVAMGHRVIAVDDSPEMLSANHSATETVPADLFTLALGRRFDAGQVTDEMLEEEAQTAGLRLSGWLDERRTWARLGAVETDDSRY
jgi:SAM-dependent methyltransferase